METMQLINEYREAYQMANGSDPPAVTYSRGWFRIGHPSRPVRRRQLMQFRDVLLDRAAKKTSSSIPNGYSK